MGIQFCFVKGRFIVIKSLLIVMAKYNLYWLKWNWNMIWKTILDYLLIYLNLSFPSFKKFFKGSFVNVMTGYMCSAVTHPQGWEADSNPCHFYFISLHLFPWLPSSQPAQGSCFAYLFCYWETVGYYNLSEDGYLFYSFTQTLGIWWHPANRWVNL